MTLDDIRRFLDAEKLQYYLASNQKAVMIGITGAWGRYQFIVSLDQEGTFLQFRTIDYLHCPPAHPYTLDMLQLLALLNYNKRLMKYGWDAQDGEIVAYADNWVMDGTLTQQQFSIMLRVFMPLIDLNYSRIGITLETGEDPGEEVLVQMAEKLGRVDMYAPELHALKEQLRAKRKQREQGEDLPITEI